MDHIEIEKQQIVERYLAGRLPEEDAARFEEHYLECAHCLERLELGRRFRRGLLATEQDSATSPRAAGSERPVVGRPWWSGLPRSGPAAFLAAAAMLLVMLPSTLLWTRAGNLRQSLDETRRQLELSRHSVLELEQQLAGLGKRLGAEVDRQHGEAHRTAALERELRRVRAERQGLEQRLAQERRPRVNTPILHLSPLRSAASRPPETRLTLSGEPEWLVLVLDLGGLVNGAFMVTLRGLSLEGQAAEHDAGARPLIWQGRDLLPDGSGSLTLSLHSGLLGPGDYQLLARSQESGPGEPLEAWFSFRLSASRPPS